MTRIITLICLTAISCLAVIMATTSAHSKNPTTAEVPVGTVVAYAGQVTAGAEPKGWLLCNGRPLAIDKYKSLYDVLGNLYGRVDAAAGTFTLPDYQGMFLRGTANGSINDPDRDTRSPHKKGATVSGDTVGTRQPDEVRSHTHVAPVGAGGNKPGKYINRDKEGNEGISPSVDTEKTGGSETRPVNISVNYLIKY